MMDNCCAPQWADFEHSPQVLYEDYFEREHSVHGPRFNLKCIKQSDSSTPAKSDYEKSMNDTKFDDSLEEQPPVNTAYFIPHDPKKAIENAKKENQLKNLKLNEKSNKVHQAWSISATELSSNFKVSMAEDKNKPMLPERIRKRLMEPRKVHAKNIRKDSLQGKKQSVNEKRLSYRLAQSSLSTKKRRSIGKYPRVLTCQHHRRSLTKHTLSKFISLAEAVSKYQNGTPERFRTLSNKPGPLMRLKRSPMKLTVPISPALGCKKRVRQTTILSQEEREKLQIEELKKNPIRANPVPVNILKGPAVLKKVPKRPTTITEEFHLSQPKKKINEEKDQGTTRPTTRSMSATNEVENKDNGKPISKRTRQTMHENFQEKSSDKEQKNAPVTVSSNVIVKKDTCTDSPGKKTRHTIQHVNMHENKKEQKASGGPFTRSISASNVPAKKEMCTDSPSKKTRHTIQHMNTQENKEEQKTSGPFTRSTSASNVIAKKGTCTDSPSKKTRHTTQHVNIQENKKEQKASAPATCSTNAPSVAASTGSSVNKTRHTSAHVNVQEGNGKEKKASVPVTRSISASNIKKSNNICTDQSMKKPRHIVLHRSMQENKEKKEVPIIRSVSASSINRKKENSEWSKGNFEARNKEFQAKKEEKLKSLQEMNKIKAEFHARPAPKFAKTTLTQKEPKNKPVITTCPFSFEERYKNLTKKKEELMKQKQEQETKTWVFHANPVPNFKRVTVPGAKKPMRPKSCNDQENRQPNVMVSTDKNLEAKTVNKFEKGPEKRNVDTDKLNQKTVSKLELKTDKRAKERTEFDEKLKKNEQEMTMKKLEEEKSKMLREKMETAKLRKMREIKARPMPVYKPIIAIKSMKPPTIPHSPALGIRNRTKSAS